MDIIQLAQESGMQLTLDGRIGREEYRSFYGSLTALQRFADAIRASLGSGPINDGADGAMSSTAVSR